MPGVDICHYLPPDRTWHKVNDPKVDYSGGLGEGWARAEPRALQVYDAARPPECGQAENEGLTTSSLLLLDCAQTSGRVRCPLFIWP